MALRSVSIWRAKNSVFQEDEKVYALGTKEFLNQGKDEPQNSSS